MFRSIGNDSGVEAALWPTITHNTFLCADMNPRKVKNSLEQDQKQNLTPALVDYFFCHGVQNNLILETGLSKHLSQNKATSVRGMKGERERCTETHACLCASQVAERTSWATPCPSVMPIKGITFPLWHTHTHTLTNTDEYTHSPPTWACIHGCEYKHAHT